MVTSAHHEEVGVSADGHASAPPSGAAAGGRPCSVVSRHVAGCIGVVLDIVRESVA
jgi:hypothetical protein